MSGITDNAATQAHDLVEQAEIEEQKVQGDDAMIGGVKTTGLEGSAPDGGKQTGGGQKSTLDKVKETLHLKK
ncbi:hypothetical protein M406DRAFT_354110 [Cryphonectria parasitica EP155]|uniref:Uncharacterized protein n=1 Tax=Cryphonectria parasitica (strain ATCC 38755 / EP155) TaxID=660469 RepID=A0A9P5CTI4_CRYP1|nr:uncharacterized protein M406DRAFT_354110 [Cryphonectria parasitica EP155]KAF3769697.1 hypothetical protein M406DRAFT_354110 [Cryphonectria parasitica EP155]